jgi:hypothetical protein
MDERFHAEVCLLLFSGGGEAQAVCCPGQDFMDFLHEVGLCRFSQARMDADVFYVHHIDNSSEPSDVLSTAMFLCSGWQRRWSTLTSGFVQRFGGLPQV